MKIKRWMGIVITLAILGALTAAFFIVQSIQKKKQQEEVANYESIYVATLERDSINGIEILKTGMNFTKDSEGKWKLETLPEYPIDESKISSIVYSLSALRADRIIEEDAEDLTVYGLDAPQAKVSLKTPENVTETILLGNQTPTKLSYYVLREGSRTVYTISTYVGDNFFRTPAYLRTKDFPTFIAEEVEYFRLKKNGEVVLEIQPILEGEKEFASLSALKMVAPYKNWQSVNADTLTQVAQQIAAVSIQGFADEIDSGSPEVMTSIGLNPPRYELLARDKETTFELLTGNPAPGGGVYAIRGEDAGSNEKGPQVYIIPDIFSSVQISPFELADKFALILNIESVDEVRIESTKGNYVARIQRTLVEGQEEPETSYSINGQQIEEKPFKNFYQATIGLVADAENPKGNEGFVPEITVTYTMNTPGNPSPEVKLAPYNRDFYAVGRNGGWEFLISRKTVNKMFDTVEDVLAGGEGKLF